MPSHDAGKVLVAGTTTDYIDWLRRVRPGQCVFLTSPALRQKALEPFPEPGEEILAPLDNAETCLQAVAQHVRRHGLTLFGIACYDCESMPLAAQLARRLGLDYPSPQAVRHCRDKSLAKALWRAHGLPTARFTHAAALEQVLAFRKTIHAPIVLKPVDGAGSELVFSAETPGQCARAFDKIQEGLTQRLGPHPAGFSILAEELVTGPEYSCDFVVGAQGASILRTAAKHGLDPGPFGITQAYELNPVLAGLPQACGLPEILERAASVLGIERSICMVDFILRDNKPILLEMAPRPGGDCLPLLLRTACGLDTMALAVDFAQGLPMGNPGRAPDPMAGLRVFAPASGVLKNLDPAKLLCDNRVVGFEPLKRPGDRIILPPGDYDSWILAAILYRPVAGKPVPEQNRELSAMVEISIRPG